MYYLSCCEYVYEKNFKILNTFICGQLYHCDYYPASWFRSPSSVMVSAEPFSDRSRPM